MVITVLDYVIRSRPHSCIQGNRTSVKRKTLEGAATDNPADEIVDIACDASVAATDDTTTREVERGQVDIVHCTPPKCEDLSSK